MRWTESEEFRERCNMVERRFLKFFHAMVGDRAAAMTLQEIGVDPSEIRDIALMTAMVKPEFLDETLQEFLREALEPEQQKLWRDELKADLEAKFGLVWEKSVAEPPPSPGFMRDLAELAMAERFGWPTELDKESVFYPEGLNREEWKPKYERFNAALHAALNCIEPD